MTRTTDSGQDGNRPEEMPWGLAEKILRPELPSLSEEIIEALREKIPEYARPMDGPYGQLMRDCVEQALASFVDRVADPSTSLAQRDEMARMLGEHEAGEGRSLDSLQTAYRVGSRVAWRRASQPGMRAARDGFAEVISDPTVSAMRASITSASPRDMRTSVLVIGEPIRSIQMAASALRAISMTPGSSR